MTAKHSRTLVAALIAVACTAFFLFYSFLPLAAPARFNSPDETSNSYFARLFAAKSVLWTVEPLNLFIPEGLVHPRSMKVVDNFLVPGGFIGLPAVYGTIAKVFGTRAIAFMTPLFAVGAALAWAALWSKRFGRRIGLAAGALLLVQPAWWYVASRTLQPNATFAALVIFSAAFFFNEPLRELLDRRKIEGVRLLRLTDAALAGIMLGLALWVRTSEAYWIALGIAVLVACVWPKVPWTRLAVFGVAAALTIVPLLIMNDAIYGDPLATGYGSGLSVPAGALPHGRGDAMLGALRPILFPLGFAPRAAFAHFWTYGMAFFGWWTTLVACAGAAYLADTRLARRKWPRDAAIFGAFSLSVALWLLLFYGSWNVQDNPDPTAVTIGSSYLRYWLPISVLSTLPVAWLVVKASERFVGVKRAYFAAAFIGCAALASASDVFWSPDEGLLAVRATLLRYDAIVARITAVTPANSLVVADSADKHIFPYRSVLTPLRSEENYAALATLKRHAPIYYYGITFPEKDLVWLRDEKLPPLGLSIEPVETFGEETLYKMPSTDPRFQEQLIKP